MPPNEALATASKAVSMVGRHVQHHQRRPRDHFFFPDAGVVDIGAGGRTESRAIAEQGVTSITAGK